MKSNLEKLMKKNNINIKELHKCTKLSRTTISNILNNKVTRIDYITIEKLCSALKCGIGELLVLEDSEGGNK